MYKQILVLCLVLYTSVAYGALTAAQNTTIASWHASMRSAPSPAAASTLAPIVWDSSMASTLQTFADTCSKTFSSQASYGINSEFMWTWSPYSSFNVATILATIKAQNVNFNFTTKACNPGTSCYSWVYVMNTRTTKYACALANCSNVAYFYCDYNAVTYANQNPYTLSSTPTTTPATTAPATTTPATTTPAPTTTAASSTISWKSYQTPIRDQGQCGSCWAFSTMAALESRYLIKYGTSLINSLNLAEENPVSCISNYCSGGWPMNILTSSNFKTYGVAYEADNPYTAAAGTCTYNTGKARFSWVGSGQLTASKAALIAGLKSGPIIIVLYADAGFQSYVSGIYKPTTKQSGINHAVLLVGYDATGDYWTIKNSWGTYWGESGYIRITATTDNLNILSYGGMYPTF